MAIQWAIAEQKNQADQLSEEILLNQIRVKADQEILKKQLAESMGSPAGLAVSFLTGFSVVWLFGKRQKLTENLSKLPWASITSAATTYLASKQ